MCDSGLARRAAALRVAQDGQACAGAQLLSLPPHHPAEPCGAVRRFPFHRVACQSQAGFFSFFAECWCLHLFVSCEFGFSIWIWPFFHGKNPSYGLVAAVRCVPEQRLWLLASRQSCAAGRRHGRPRREVVSSGCARLCSVSLDSAYAHDCLALLLTAVCSRSIYKVTCTASD